MIQLKPTGKRTNHKGIAAAAKDRRRAEAEVRQAEYAKKSLSQKMKTAGRKEQMKLAAKVQP